MTSRASDTARLPLAICLGWGMGGFGTIMLGNAYGALLMRYMTDFLGMAAATAALLFALCKMFDAAVDPLIGALTDRTRTRIGRRRPFLLAGVVLGPLAMIAMFVVPDLTGAALTAYMVGVLIFYATCYALWEVPYLAMPTEMTGHYGERTRLAAYQSYGRAFGQAIFVAAGPWTLAYLGSSRTDYGLMALLLAALVLAGNLICFLSTAKARFTPEVEAERFDLLQTYIGGFSSRPFTLLVVAKGLMFVGLSAQGGVFAYFLHYGLKVGDAWLGTFLLVMTASSMLSVPVWMTVTRHVEKRTGALIAGAIFVAASFSWITARPGEPDWLLMARGIVKGFGLTGYLIYLYSMFIDVIDYDHALTGIRREGAFAGVFATAEKICAALGLAAVGGILGRAGYIASTSADAVQPEGAVLAIRLVYALAPTAMGLLSMLALLAYPISSKRLAEMRERRLQREAPVGAAA